ncbi:MAG: F0F1 ATP synthase subunit delta [Burkholderiales bacterium]|nr:F0F1 ATP synthase subunit delta [Burkholderiales bacterium]
MAELATIARPYAEALFKASGSDLSAAAAQSGSSDAVVYSAFPIDASALAEVAVMLEKRFGRKLNPSVVLQPELIGGIRVVVGDEVLDTSVKARLEQMKVALTA